MRKDMSWTKIRFLGDWAPEDRHVEKVNFNEFIFLNLEGPIMKVKKDSRSLKAGPILSSENFINSKSQGVGILANNHSFDYGYYGYKKTKQLLKKKKWFSVGADITKSKAEKPLIFNLNDTVIGVLARCEIQFGVSQFNKPGVASYNENIYKQIQDLKKKTDLVIVSYHGAAEMLPWPSPGRQDLFRSLIDMGADIVYGHHAHTPHGWEKYSNGLIFYGLGNFCVNPLKWSWHPNGLWSLTPEISIMKKKIKFQPRTSVIKEHDKKISVIESSRKEHSKHLSYLKLCNQPLKNRILLEGLWQEASLKMYHNHYANWLEFNSINKINIYRPLKRITSKLINSILSKKTDNIPPKIKQYLLHYHLFACDSHREAVSTALGLLSGELNDLRNKVTKKLIDKWMIDQND